MPDQRPSAPSVLITGCSSGIGRCVADGLAARGYRVFATARRELDVRSLRQAGHDSVQLDVADSGSIAEAITTVIEQTGGELFALFNNAGYGQTGAVEDLSRSALREQFETNLFGVLELTNRVIPYMRRNGRGRIIMNSSLLGFVTLPYRGAYNASKFALEGLSHTLRQELRGTGIFVSLIRPGPIATRFRANAYAAFQRHIHPDNSAHLEAYRGLERRLSKPGPAAPFTLPPTAVLKKVVHALESRNPKPYYYVTFPSHLFALLQRLLPSRALDLVLQRVARGERR